MLRSQHHRLAVERLFCAGEPQVVGADTCVEQEPGDGGVALDLALGDQQRHVRVGVPGARCGGVDTEDGVVTLHELVLQLPGSVTAHDRAGRAVLDGGDPRCGAGPLSADGAVGQVPRHDEDVAQLKLLGEPAALAAALVDAEPVALGRGLFRADVEQGLVAAGDCHQRRDRRLGQLLRAGPGDSGLILVRNPVPADAGVLFGWGERHRLRAARCWRAGALGGGAGSHAVQVCGSPGVWRHAHRLIPAALDRRILLKRGGASPPPR